MSFNPSVRYWAPPPSLCHKCGTRHEYLAVCPEKGERRLHCAGHMHYFMEPTRFRTKVRQSVKALANYNFDALAFRGMSGAFIGPSVALRMRKSVLLVRKPEDTTHSVDSVEGDLAARSYIIIDDFISSGQTREAIIKAVKEFAPRAECLGLLSVNHLNDDRLKQYAGRQYPLDEVE